VTVPRRLSRSAAAAATLLAAGMLTSCGDNFGAQTDQIYNPAVGVNNRNGAVYVLNALIVSGTNGSGTVVATLVNENQNQPDRLISVDAANPRNQDITGKVFGPTTIPAGGMLNLANSGGATVRGQTVAPGSFVPLRFTFAHAASAVVNVPVEPHSDPDYSHVPLP
jgi:hypothetical protein